MYLQMVKALGGNPIVIPPSEFYTTLQTGVVDGYCWPSVGIMDWGWQKLTKFVLEPGFYQVPNPLLVSHKAWQRLPKNLRKLITEAAVEAEKEAVKYSQELEKAERPKLLKERVQVVELPAGEREKFLKTAYDATLNEIMEKCPQNGSELKKLLIK